MNLLKSIYYHSCSLLPMQLLKTMGAASTLFPYHHTVSNESLPHIKHLYNYKNDIQFIKDLDFLLKHFTPVAVSDIITSVRQEKKLPSQSFLLSFDDGFKEVHDVIAPILEKKSVPAIFFINPAFIDNKELFYRCKISLLIDELLNNKNYLQLYNNLLKIENKSLNNTIASLKTINQINSAVLDIIAEKIDFSFNIFLQKQQPFLTTKHLRSLHKRGFSIGAHSINHPYYPLLPLEAQFEQTRSSCQYVNEHLGINNCCFSFPHSDKDISQALFNSLKKIDIPLFFGIQNQKNEISNNMIHRFNAERSEVNFENQVKGIILLTWMRQITGNNDVKRNNDF